MIASCFAAIADGIRSRTFEWIASSFVRMGMIALKFLDTFTIFPRSLSSEMKTTQDSDVWKGITFADPIIPLVNLLRSPLNLLSRLTVASKISQRLLTLEFDQFINSSCSSLLFSETCDCRNFFAIYASNGKSMKSFPIVNKRVSFSRRHSWKRCSEVSR